MSARWTRVLVLAVLAALVPPAAAQESPEPVDATIVGTVVAGDGTPARDVVVDVVATDTGLSGAAFGLLTFGLACITGICSSSEDPVATMRTEHDGSYRGPLPSSYVPGQETDTDWIITASRQAAAGQIAGATSSFELEVNTAVQEAPPLPLWELTPSTTLEGWRVRVSVASPPAGLDDVRIAVTNGEREGVSVPGLAADVDLRRLEAGPNGEAPFVAATAYADVTVPHREGRTIYHQRVTTPVLPAGLVAAQLVPPSRGGRCTFTRADGDVVPVDSCAVTDGERLSSVTDVARDGAPPAAVTVELAEQITLADVFVRGCDLACRVSASADGATWGDLAIDQASSSQDSPFREEQVLVASLRPPLPARFVRVERPEGVLATEVSAWPPSPPAKIEPAVGGSGGEQATAGADDVVDVGTVRSGPPLLATAAASLLAGAAGAASVVAVSRRRRG